jgi:hypothetical protein
LSIRRTRLQASLNECSEWLQELLFERQMIYVQSTMYNVFFT